MTKIQSKTVSLVNINNIKCNDKNPNKHSDEQIERLCKIITYQGFRDPLIISNLSGLLVSGHGRLLAAKKIGMTEVPVIFQDFIDEDQEYAALVSENSIASWAELDFKGINLEIPNLGPDFDLELLGLKDFQLDFGINDKEEDSIPDHPKVPFSKIGDVYILGNHRLMCGDSTDKKIVDDLIDKEKIDMVFTDPPYGIGLKYNNHDDSEEKWFELIDKIMPISKDAAPFVIMPCCRIKSLPWWYKNHTPDWIMCWYKGSPGHRSHVGFNDWEPHLVWGKPKNQMHDYWQTACGFEVDGHPCPKPVAYCEWIITRAVDKGDNILDLFGGSGSTLIACEKTKRKCFMMELDPHYIDVIVSRYCKFVGSNKVIRNGEEMEWTV